jgi:predicted thioesterase
MRRLRSITSIAVIMPRAVSAFRDKRKPNFEGGEHGLAPGNSEQAFTVTRELTAAALAEHVDPTGVTLPEVWSTPDMIGKMEIVAAALVAPHLEAGQMTVGSRNDVSHLAATPIGQRVRVRVALVEVDGRKLTFNVTAFDEKEKVGEGTQVRFVLDAAKFAARLREKAGA